MPNVPIFDKIVKPTAEAALESIFENSLPLVIIHNKWNNLCCLVEICEIIYLYKYIIIFGLQKYYK